MTRITPYPSSRSARTACALPDHDGPAAEDEDTHEVDPLGHQPSCARTLVRIIDGPFADFNGVVEAVFPEQEGLRVAAVAFGRSTPTEVSFSQVEKT